MALRNVTAYSNGAADGSARYGSLAANTETADWETMAAIRMGLAKGAQESHL